MKLTPAQRYALRAFEGRRYMHPPRMPRTTADVLVRLGLITYRLSVDEFWTRDAVIELTDEGLALAIAADQEWRGRQGVEAMEGRALLEASRASRAYPDVRMRVRRAERGDAIELLARHKPTGQPASMLLTLTGWRSSARDIVRDNVWEMMRILSEIMEDRDDEGAGR